MDTHRVVVNYNVRCIQCGSWVIVRSDIDLYRPLPLMAIECLDCGRKREARSRMGDPGGVGRDFDLEAIDDNYAEEMRQLRANAFPKYGKGVR